MIRVQWYSVGVAGTWRLRSVSLCDDGSYPPVTLMFTVAPWYERGFVPGVYTTQSHDALPKNWIAV